MTKEEAHHALDMARSGVDVPRDYIDDCLRLTGDLVDTSPIRERRVGFGMDPFTAAYVSLGTHEDVLWGVA